jgi:ketosteroid isomerase-like protein
MSVEAERDPVALMRRMFDAFQSGDYDAIMGALHEDCEFRNPEHAIEPGIRRGPAEFRRALENVNQILEFTIEFEEIRRSGDTVVVGYRAIGKGRESGVPIDQRFGHVWKFEDGKVKTLEWFSSFDEALAGAGSRRDTP